MFCIKTLFNTPDERHAFIIGFCETFAIRRPFIGLGLNALGWLRCEYQYYTFGRAMGVLAWVGVIVGLVMYFT